MKLAMKWDVEKRTSCRTRGSGSDQGSSREPLIRRESPPSTHSVLVIDDDLNLARLMATILRTSGIDAVTANDGRAALDAVEHNDVDAIVLDLQMPQLDGRGFYRELRARGNTTPVLVASAYDAREAQHELGAQAAIEKPFDPEALVSELQRIMAA